MTDDDKRIEELARELFFKWLVRTETGDKVDYRLKDGRNIPHEIAEALRTYGQSQYRLAVERCIEIGKQDWVFAPPSPANKEESVTINHLAGWQGGTNEYRKRIESLLPPASPADAPAEGEPK